MIKNGLKNLYVQTLINVYTWVVYVHNIIIICLMCMLIGCKLFFFKLKSIYVYVHVHSFFYRLMFMFTKCLH